MAHRRPSVFWLLFGNVWTLICIAAAASCIVLAIQLLQRAPAVDTGVARGRMVIGGSALLGALAGLYGVVASILLTFRTLKIRRLRRSLGGLQKRTAELEESRKQLESLRRSQRARLDELSMLREVATVVNQESDFGIIAEKVLGLIDGLLEPLECTIFLQENGQKGLRPFAQCSDGKVLTGRKVLTRTIPDFDLSEFESHSIICRVHGQELHAMVPLKVEENTLGVLFLVFLTDARPDEVQAAEFNRTRRPLLLEITHHISLAVKTKHLHTQAVVDALTRLYSRRHFNSQLEAAVELAQRAEQVFSLVLVDIDHFKKINDTYGHTTGDVVLARLAHRIQSGLRKYDTAYRYGGEEMAILLPHTPTKQATGIAERLRALIESQKFRTADGKLVKVTISLGVAQFRSKDEAQAVFDRADRRLYRAKREGRNRVVPAAA